MQKLRSSFAIILTVCTFVFSGIGQVSPLDRNRQIDRRTPLVAIPKERVDLLISGGTVVTMNAEHELITDGAIAIKGDKIVAVGERKDLISEVIPNRVVNATGKVIMPGLINTHT